MKPTIASILLFVSVALPALATTIYRGSITQTTQGQTFLGYYEYQSSSIDGTFYILNYYYYDPGLNCTLDGLIYMPFASSVIINPPDGESFVKYGIGPTWERLSVTNHSGWLDVENGHVADFWWDWEDGGFYFYATKDDFMAISFMDASFADSMPMVYGSLVLGDPVNIPDEAATASLLSGMVIAFVVIRRQVARRCGSLNQG